MNNRSKSYIIFFLTLFTYLITSGQTRVLDIPNSTAPSGSDWCWAVSTHMATLYYGNDTELCEIVEWARRYVPVPFRGYSNCCNYPTPTDCYGALYTSYLDEVLHSEGLDCSISYDVVSLNTLQSTINDNRPLLIQGHHSTGGWHTMIIKGYDGDYIYYNDGGDSYMHLYNDAITIECLGNYLWQWCCYTHTLTNYPCPIDLDLTAKIDANADIVAQSEIIISCEIGSNRNITLIAGGGITFNSGFMIPSGSTLEADVASNPCP